MPKYKIQSTAKKIQSPIRASALSSTSKLFLPIRIALVMPNDQGHQAEKKGEDHARTKFEMQSVAKGLAIALN
ncbi:hypothetical protein MASR2M29_02860 [Spirochaetota bacterium]